MTKQERANYMKQYYLEHKEQRKQYSKRYHVEHREKEAERKRKYQKTHPEIYREISKRYRKNHPEKVKAYDKQYRKENALHREEYTRQWEKDNPEKQRKINTRHKSKRRQLGFEPLNKPQSGYVAHHVNKIEIIYIPEELHRSIWHCLETGQNMNIINSLAVQYLQGDSR